MDGAFSESKGEKIEKEERDRERKGDVEIVRIEGRGSERERESKRESLPPYRGLRQRI